METDAQRLTVQQLLTGLQVRCGAVLFALVLCTCARERPLAPKPVPEPLVHEPWENAEAENLAWLVSGQLSAPRPLYDRIKADLESIRARWTDSLRCCDSGDAPYWHEPVLDKIKHWPFSTPGVVELTLDSEAYAQAQQGIYHDWDSLNACFQAMTFQPWVGWPVFVVKSNYRLSPLGMASIYDDLSGVHEAGPFGLPFGDHSNLYAFQFDWGIGYLFCYAWGDCPMGCLYRRYYYFRARAKTTEYVGTCFNPRYDPAPPSWWTEARACEGLWRYWEQDLGLTGGAE